jgi:hypothetical protein
MNHDRHYLRTARRRSENRACRRVFLDNPAGLAHVLDAIRARAVRAPRERIGRGLMPTARVEIASSTSEARQHNSGLDCDAESPCGGEQVPGRARKKKTRRQSRRVRDAENGSNQSSFSLPFV